MFFGGDLMKAVKLVIVGAACLAASSAALAASTLEAVKKKGFVQCGVSTGIAGFSMADAKGEWVGFDIDMCRAIAATVFNDASKFRVTPLNTQQRFTALQSGEIDVLTRHHPNFDPRHHPGHSRRGGELLRQSGRDGQKESGS